MPEFPPGTATRTCCAHFGDRSLDADGAPECVEICNGIDDDADGVIDEGHDDGTSVATWVDAAALPGGDGTAARPFGSVQDAVDNRAPFDPCPIRVAPGTYFERVEVEGGLLQIIGTAGAASTVIDASASGSVMHVEATLPGSTVQGITLQGGGPGADEGGGLVVEEGSLDVIDCFLLDNTRHSSGGGLMCRSCTGLVQGNVVSDNHASAPGFDFPFGGGIAVAYGGAAPVLDHNLVQYNTVEAAEAFGGGIGVWGASEVEILANTVHGNTATHGGGISVRDGSTGVLYNNLIQDNLALGGAAGSGIELANDRGSIVVNHTLVGNQGGGGQVRVSWPQSDPYIANSILAFGSAAALIVESGAPSWVYNDVFGHATPFDGLADPTGVNGNLAVDPGFVLWVDDSDPATDDLDLGPGSPCVDAGNPSATFDDADGTRNDLGVGGGPVAL